MPAAAAAPAGVDPDASRVVELRLATGRVVRMTVGEGLRHGLLLRDARGKLRGVAAAGVATASYVAAPSRPRQQPVLHGPGAMTLGMDGAAAPPKHPSEALGEMASAAFLARGLLSIAKGPGWPSWQTVYFAANGVDHFTGHKFLPDWLHKGPVKDILEFAVIGDMLHSSWPEIPAANKLLRTTLGRLQAGHGAGHVSLLTRAGDVARALVTKGPAEQGATPVATAAAAGAAVAKANVPFIEPLFKLIKPLFYLGMTASSVAGMIALPEYLHDHGAHGLVNTTSGRDAWIGALSGATMLASMYLPASPLQSYMDMASTVLWLVQAVNGHGWLDAILGGDPPEPDAGATASASKARPPAGSGVQLAPATAAVDAAALAAQNAHADLHGIAHHAHHSHRRSARAAHEVDEEPRTGSARSTPRQRGSRTRR